MVQQRMKHFSLIAVVTAYFVCGTVNAQTVFKCVDAHGNVSYQGKPCPLAATQTQMELSGENAKLAAPNAAAPKGTRAAAQTPADSSAPVPPAGSATAATAADSPSSNAAAESWQCTASDGEVFYRHDACPGTITTTITQVCGKRGCFDQTNIAQVSAKAIPREEACSQINARMVSDRAGHQHDQTVSTYEHDLGHDPCG